MDILKNLTIEDVQRYTRIALQWLSAFLVTHGTVKGDTSWIEPAIGVGVAIASFAWTIYGNRLKAKIDEVAKADTVKNVLVKDQKLADAAPSPKVTTQ